jgi:hypothetical protein
MEDSMGFPPYVHSIIPDDAPTGWPIQKQGINECGCTAPANAINLLLGTRTYEKDQFVREAGIWFKRHVFGAAGGTPSFVTGWLIKRHGFGTHFGSLRHTDAEAVLRDLINRGVPVVLELGANKVGPLTIWGQHSVVLVGYSDRYVDAQGQARQEYYFVDAEYFGSTNSFGLHTNDSDRDGDGVAEMYPGNRTIEREEFLRNFPTGIYYPVFRTQQEHDAWAARHLHRSGGLPILGTINNRLLTGTRDIWRG